MIRFISLCRRAAKDPEPVAKRPEKNFLQASNRKIRGKAPCEVILLFFFQAFGQVEGQDKWRERVKPKMAKIQNKLVKFSLWGRLINDFKLLFSLIKDYWKGVYRDVSIWSILVSSLTIIYILSPIDIIPDFILGIGQIDDAAVLLLCVYFLEKDLYKYQEWKNRHSE